MAVIRGRSRPPRATPAPTQVPSGAQLDIYFATYEESLDRYTARKAAGLTRPQLDALLQDKAFLARMAEIVNEAVERVEGATFRNAVIKGDKDAQKLILQAKMASVYGPKANVNVHLTPDQLKAMADDELEQMIDRLSKARG